VSDDDGNPAPAGARDRDRAVPAQFAAAQLDWPWNGPCWRPGISMLDREKVVAVLKRRFPGSAIEQVAAAANAIVGLEDEWLEIQPPAGGWEQACRDGCVIRRLSGDGPIKLFRRENHGR
jgi:hypothetical protein